MAMKVIGFKRNDFESKGNEHFGHGEITGINLFCTYKLEGGTGVGCSRFYLTDKKLSESNYLPAVGDEVEFTYNRFGKIASITKVK